MEVIRKKLFELQDLGYLDFNAKLIPTVSRESIIGVRISDIRTLARRLCVKDCDRVARFMDTLPHKYLEENTFHGMAIGELYQESITETLARLDRFLPYVDNWETCDAIKLPIFKREPKQVRNAIRKWLLSEHVYVVRFAVVTLLSFYLDSEFDRDDLIVLSKIQRDEYYINMALAWYYSTALVKQYDETIKIFKNPILNKWVHNKSIQKARESHRIDGKKKEYLQALKVR